MYPWLWRNLPGPTGLKVMLLFALAALIVAALFLAVFPVVDSHLQFDQSHVESLALPATAVTA
ncbi:MAG: hypothetical protein KDC39_02585 [Actinobacteria bacterium]|nr:hypothetical protein [Actinomycetota bacterium]